VLDDLILTELATTLVGLGYEPPTQQIVFGVLIPDRRRGLRALAAPARPRLRRRGLTRLRPPRRAFRVVFAPVWKIAA
jgi:hypothetical protein